MTTARQSALIPSLALLYHSRGAAYKELKQYQRGIEDFNAATRLDKDDGYAYNNRGIAYSIQGDKASGCSDFKRACELEHARD